MSVGVEIALMSRVIAGEPAAMLTSLLYSCLLDNGKTITAGGKPVVLGQATGTTRIALSQLANLALGSVSPLPIQRVTRALSVLEVLGLISLVGGCSTKLSTVYTINYDAVKALRKSVLISNAAKIEEIKQKHFPVIPDRSIENFVTKLIRAWGDLGGLVNISEQTMSIRFQNALDSCRITYPTLKSNVNAYLSHIQGSDRKPCKLKTYMDHTMWEFDAITGDMSVDARLMFLGEAKLATTETSPQLQLYQDRAQQLVHLWESVNQTVPHTIKHITQMLTSAIAKGVTLETISTGAVAYINFVRKAPIAGQKDIRTIWSFISDECWTINWDNAVHSRQRRTRIRV